MIIKKKKVLDVGVAQYLHGMESPGFSPYDNGKLFLAV